MDSKFKRIFLMCTVIVPFAAYCIYYYAHMFKNAPYKFTEFVSMTFEYGPGDSLVNKYNSKTGEYQFQNDKDSLIKMNLHIPKEELLYLHHKAAELGFWDFPSVEVGDTTIKHNGSKPLRFVITFNYKRKSKKVIYDSSFDSNPRLKDANEQMIKEITKVLDEEQGKQRN